MPFTISIKKVLAAVDKKTTKLVQSVKRTVQSDKTSTGSTTPKHKVSLLSPVLISSRFPN